MDRATALLINTAMMLVVIPAMPLSAIVGDRWVPRRTWIGIAVLMLAILAWPLYAWVIHSHGSLTSVIVTHALTFLLLAVPLGSAPALFVEMFPERDRLSGYSVAFNVGLGVFGGLTPVIATSLIAASGTPSALTFYLAIAALVAVFSLALIPDRSREPLR